MFRIVRRKMLTILIALFIKIKTEDTTPTKGTKQAAVVSPTKGGRKKKEEEQAEVWKW